MRPLAALLALLLVACGRIGYDDVDGGTFDASTVDGGAVDAGTRDATAPDAARDAGADAPGDAGVDAHEPAPDACTPGEETCNGRDDDCDGEIDEPFVVVASWDECTTSPRGGALTLVTFTFDREDAIRAATVVEGGVEIARIGTLSTPGAAMLDPSRTIGNLLSPPSTATARWVPFPEVGFDTTVEPNVTRAAIEGHWGDWGMRDGAGDDLLVLEHGGPISEPEGFAISVRDARTGTWSAIRYEHFDAFSEPDGMFATAFDLEDFGLAGGVVDRVRIHNVFGAAAEAPDRVDDASGEGRVIRAGEPGYDGAFAMTTSPDGVPYPTSLLDTDLLFVTALHPTAMPSCCVAP